MACPKREQTAIHVASISGSLRKTIELIGRAVVEGSAYLPLRSHVARIATQARPKDYLGQLAAVYRDFLKRWRYVRDPFHFECVPIDGPTIWGQVWGFDVKGGKGWGDCDCASVALGSALASIGFPVRIVTIAGLKSLGPLSHVYIEAAIPGFGWVPVDPVGYPAHDLGWAAPAKRKAIWGLDGTLIAAAGDWSGESRKVLGGNDEMLSAAETDRAFPDYGLERYGLAGDDEPADMAIHGDVYGFGAYVPEMGLIGHGMGLLMEVDQEDQIRGTDLVRTKILEMSPTDWREVLTTGRPRLGAVALADDGSIYQYQYAEGLGGFFKKLFKRIKKGFKKVAGFAKSLIKKLPGGKYLIKIYDRVHAIAMKIVKPLVKFVGKYAAKLAPIAAFIPGFGPAVAGGLLIAGRIAKVMQETGVFQDKKGKPVFKSGAQAIAFKKALHREAAHLHAARVAAHKAGKKLVIRPAIAAKAIAVARKAAAAPAMKAIRPIVARAAARGPQALPPGWRVIKGNSPQAVAALQRLGFALYG